MYSSHFCGMQICTKETCLLSRPRPVRAIMVSVPCNMSTSGTMAYSSLNWDDVLQNTLCQARLDRCFALRDLIRMERISCRSEKSGILNVSTEFRYLRCTEIFWNSHNVRSWNLGTYGPSYIAHSQVPRPTLQCQSGNQTTLHTSATSKQPYKRCMGIW